MARLFHATSTKDTASRAALKELHHSLPRDAHLSKRGPALATTARWANLLLPTAYWNAHADLPRQWTRLAAMPDGEGGVMTGDTWTPDHLRSLAQCHHIGLADDTYFPLPAALEIDSALRDLVAELASHVQALRAGRVLAVQAKSTPSSLPLGPGTPAKVTFAPECSDTGCIQLCSTSPSCIPWVHPALVECDTSAALPPT